MTQYFIWNHPWTVTVKVQIISWLYSYLSFVYFREYWRIDFIRCYILSVILWTLLHWILLLIAIDLMHNDYRIPVIFIIEDLNGSDFAMWTRVDIINEVIYRNIQSTIKFFCKILPFSYILN